MTGVPPPTLYHRWLGWHAPAMRRAITVLIAGLIVAVVLLPFGLDVNHRGLGRRPFMLRKGTSHKVCKMDIALTPEWQAPYLPALFRRSDVPN